MYVDYARKKNELANKFSSISFLPFPYFESYSATRLSQKLEQQRQRNAFTVEPHLPHSRKGSSVDSHASMFSREGSSEPLNRRGTGARNRYRELRIDKLNADNIVEANESEEYSPTRSERKRSTQKML